MAKKVLELQTEIGISGESDYRDACKEISKNLSVLNSEMRLLTAEFAGNEKSTEALTAKQDVLKKKMAEQEQQVKATEEMLAKLKETGQEGSDTWKTYEVKLNNSKAALKDTENQIAFIDDELQKNKITWQQVGDAIGAAGKVIGGAVVALGTAALGAATGLAKLTLDTSQWADDLQTTAEQTRQSAEDLQKWDYACKIIDADMDTLTKTMAKNIKSMDAARDGSAQFADAYGKLGVKITNSDGSLRDSNDVYWETIDALGAMTNETERDALSMQIFGKSAQDMNVIIGAGSEAFKEMGDKAEAMGAVLSEDQLDRLGAFDDKMMDLQTATDGLKRSSSLIALPFLDELAADGIPILTDFSKAINEADGDIGKIGNAAGKAMSDVVKLVTTQMPKFLDMGVNMVEALITGIVSNAPLLADGAVQIVTTLVDALVTLLPLIVEGALQILTAFANGLAESLPVIIPAVVSLIPLIITTILENLPMLLEAALAIVTGLMDGILASIPILIEALPQIIDGIVTFLIGAVPQLISAGIQLLTALVTALPEIITAIVAALPQIISAIVQALAESIPQLIDAGVKLFIAIIENLPLIITTIVGAVPEIIGAILDAIRDNRHSIVDSGKNLIEGLWEGIIAMKDWLFDKVSGFFGDVVRWAKDVLGVKSPSTVFAGIGEYMAEGLGEGFADQIGAVGRKIQQATKEIIPDLDFDFPVPKYFRSSESINGRGMTIIDRLQVIVNVPAGSDGRDVGKAAAGSLIQTLKTAGVIA